jgi:ribose transport system substrate-binding protein
MSDLIPGLPIPNGVLIMFIVAIVCAVILNKTALGRYTFALGSNEEAVRLSGVNVDRWKVIIYAFSGGICGIAGLLIASRLNSAQPALGQGYELDAIAAVVIGGTSLSGGVDRRDGFVNQIKAKYPKIKIVDIQYGGGDHLKSAEIAKTLMQAHPKLKGIFGTNEGSAIGAGKGMKEAKKTGIAIIGFDSGKAQKEMIMDGTMAGAITQNPVGIGYQTVKAAVMALKGEKLPKVIDTGFYYYDKSNMSDAKIAAVLYD